MKIPKKIKLGNTKELKIIQRDISPVFGYYDPKTEEIHIEKSLEPIGKAIILIHELLHVVDLHNLSAGVYKTGLKEIQVEHLAGSLTMVLLQNKLMGDFKPSEILKFMEPINKNG